MIFSFTVDTGIMSKYAMNMMLGKISRLDKLFCFPCKLSSHLVHKQGIILTRPAIWESLVKRGFHNEI